MQDLSELFISSATATRNIQDSGYSQPGFLRDYSEQSSPAIP